MSRLSAPLLLCLLGLTQFGCSSNTTSSAQAAANSSSSAADIHPYASLQEVMDGIVDPSADGMWDAVETTVDKDGEHDKQPRSDEEWAAVRRKTITLIEAANLLVIPGRHVAVKPFRAEAEGALDSDQIQQRLDANRPTFNAFAQALRANARQALVAIDTRDTATLVKVGGALDEVCESCHMKFWYPNQVIPPVE
jgi:hypothetical protein